MENIIEEVSNPKSLIINNLLIGSVSIINTTSRVVKTEIKKN